MATLEPPAQQGRIAVVCYVPNGLNCRLTQLMKLIPLAGPPNAHLTLLPPRPLLVSIEEAIGQAREIVHSLSAFSVGLSDVCHFPETNVLYIEIAAGNQQVRRAHAALNVRKLAYLEEYEFTPHITLSRPVAPEQIEPLKQAVRSHWSTIEGSRTFMVDHAVFLRSPDSEDGDWIRLWSEPLPLAAGV